MQMACRNVIEDMVFNASGLNEVRKLWDFCHRCFPTIAIKKGEYLNL